MGVHRLIQRSRQIFTFKKNKNDDSLEFKSNKSFAMKETAIFDEIKTGLVHEEVSLPIQQSIKVSIEIFPLAKSCFHLRISHFLHRE